MAYIERETYSKALKDLISDSDGRTNYEKGYIQGLATANGILLDENQTPTADVVEVVHCKNCKHLMFSNCYGECSKGYMGIVSPNDFCSNGVKKDCTDNKPVTQFDYFKASIAKMSIDEIAKVISGSDNCEKFCIFTKDGVCDSCGDTDVCEMGVKQWLESEVTE